MRAFCLASLVSIVALFAAKPFVALVDKDAELDPAPPAYSDFESEGLARGALATSDSELAYRATRPVEHVVQARSGDTMLQVLMRAGIDGTEANSALDSLKASFDPRSLKTGQTFTVRFDRPAHGLGQGDLMNISFNPDPMRVITAKRLPDRSFETTEDRRSVTRQIAHYSGSIRLSLFESAQNAGVPANVIVTMIRALSYDVDFQRDIQSGDSFDVMFEGYYDTNGKLVKNGDMLYAAISLSGRPIAMYRYEDSHGIVEYFNEKGESVKKALLRTPVDGAKITSGFGMRNHPILGFTKMHKGVDFGVPTGTPIMAAGDGTIEMAGFNGAYGNYVRVRHSNGFATAYAHMSRIGPGIHTGKRVSQGQTIGFVGATGRVTGPHLHFEVLQGATQINPMSVKMPTGTKLAGKELDRFRAAKSQLEALLAKTPPGAARVASIQSGSSAAHN